MKIFALIAVALAAAGVMAAESGGSARFNVATYNIRQLNAAATMRVAIHGREDIVWWPISSVSMISIYSALRRVFTASLRI